MVIFSFSGHADETKNEMNRNEKKTWVVEPTFQTVAVVFAIFVVTGVAAAAVTAVVGMGFRFFF